MSKVMVVGDTHIPAVHPAYLSFCEDLAEKYDCDTFVHIGDVADWHAVSKFGKNAEAKDAVSEFEEAKQIVGKWKRSFPKMVVCEGNHDSRIIKQAATVSIPERFPKGYNELWGTHWEWVPDYKLDEVYFLHGTGVSGQHPAFQTMQKILMSVAMGHVHSASGIKYRANPERRIFGLDVGCGVDDKHLSFKYAENLKIKSILSAAVVLDGVPIHVICPQARARNTIEIAFLRRGNNMSIFAPDCVHARTKIVYLPPDQAHYAECRCVDCEVVLRYLPHPHVVARKQKRA